MFNSLYLILLLCSNLALVLSISASRFFGKVAPNSSLLTLWASQFVSNNQKSSARVLSLSAHHRPIKLLDFSADGRLLASADSQSIVIWSVKTGEVIRILPAHSSPKSQLEILAPTSLSLSPDGRFLASSTWSQGFLNPEKSVIVWDIQTGEEIFSLKNNKGCQQVILSNSGDALYTACDSGIQVWQIENKQQIASFNDEHPVATLTLSNNGQILASVDASITGKPQAKTRNKIKLWKLSEGSVKLISTLAGHRNDIAQLEFTAGDRQLVSSSYDGSIKIWNWQKSTEEKTLTQTSANGLFSFNPNGRSIAGNFAGGKVLNVPRASILEVPVSVPFSTTASAVNFSDDGNFLAWATNSKKLPNPTLLLWQLQGEFAPNSQIQARDNYRTLPLSKFLEKLPDRDLPVSNNPQQFALTALGLAEKIESETETVEITYPQTNKVVVTISQTNLADDSVFGIRYRVEFAPFGINAENQEWQVIWAGKQLKCQSNRGHQNWSTSLCK